MTSRQIFSKTKGRELIPSEVSAIAKELERLEAKARELKDREDALQGQQADLAARECRLVVMEEEAEAALFKTPAQTNSQEAGEEYQPALRNKPRPRMKSVVELAAGPLLGKVMPTASAPLPATDPGALENKQDKVEKVLEAECAASRELRSQLQRAQHQAMDASHERDQLRAHIQTQTSQLDELRAQGKAASAKLEEQSEEVAALSGRVQQLLGQLDATQCKATEQEVQAAQAALEAHAKLVETGALLDVREREVCNLEQRLAAAEGALKESRQECESVRQRLDSLFNLCNNGESTSGLKAEKERAEAATKLSCSLQHDLQCMRNERDAILQELTLLKSERVDAKATVSGMKTVSVQTVDRACEDCADHLKTIKQLKAKTDELRETLRIAEEYVREVELRTATMHAEWLGTHAEEVRALQNHVAYLAQQITESDKHALGSLKDDMDRMRGAIKSTLEEVNRLRAELASVRGMHSPAADVLGKADFSRMDLQEKDAELRRLRSGLADALMMAKTTKSHLFASERKAKELDIKAKNARRVESTTREDMARADRKHKLLEEQADALRDEANNKSLELDTVKAELKKKTEEMRMLRVEAQSYKEETRGLRRKLKDLTDAKSINRHTSSRAAHPQPPRADDDSRDKLVEMHKVESEKARGQIMVLKDMVKSLQEQINKHPEGAAVERAAQPARRIVGGKTSNLASRGHSGRVRERTLSHSSGCSDIRDE